MRIDAIVAPLILLLLLLGSACDHRGPTAPSPSPVPTPPVPVPPVSLTDVWNITVRLTTATGGECVGETMQSQIGVPKSYSLSTTPRDRHSRRDAQEYIGRLRVHFPGQS